MYVHEELYKGQKLSEIINTTHQNPKYLSGHHIPTNVKACTCLKQVVKHADILIFVIPHQYIVETCNEIKDHIKPSAFSISLIKGFLDNKSEICMISKIVQNILLIPCDVLMGANIASEVANESFCEATIGSTNYERGYILKSLITTPMFKINISPDKDGIEICGAAKNVVAIGAGIIKGIDQGMCAVALLIRRGMFEIMLLIKHLCEDYHPATILESCGFADIIASSDGGRNARVAEQYIRSGNTSWDELEREMLNGQKLQGVQTAAIIYSFIEKKCIHDQFPLFVIIHKICLGCRLADSLIDVLKLPMNFEILDSL